ncbi:MAG: zinc-binding dehydrogenase [Bacteroidetes bacterium]|nr:zinc-binding dehydrogenase [Bacteroidota bacterium]
MQAIVCESYGSPDVLTIKDVPTPAPKDNEVLVCVHATSVNYGYLGQKMGAYAEYVAVPENDCFVEKPAALPHDEAAALPYGAVMAWHLLKKAGVRKGQKVLVNGASGGIGSAAVRGRLPFSEAKALLNDDGTVLSVSFKTRHLLQMLRSSFGGKHKMLCVLAPGKVDDLRAVRELIENGALRAHVARRFAFTDAPAAHRLVEEGKHTGAVVITFA